MIDINHTLQITSFGGSGTTMLLHFLQSQGAIVSREHGFSRDQDWGIWKHLPCPPTLDQYVLPSEFRAIYLMSDPCDALISVFQRGFHMWHAHRMQSHDLWPSTFRVAEYPVEPTWGFQDFLNLGYDSFGIGRQIANWTSTALERRRYPIMVIKYDALWDHLNDVLDFAGLSRSVAPAFPVKRMRRAKDGVEAADRIQLEMIYQSLRLRIQEMPELQVL